MAKPVRYVVNNGAGNFYSNDWQEVARLVEMNAKSGMVVFLHDYKIPKIIFRLMAGRWYQDPMEPLKEAV